MEVDTKKITVVKSLTTKAENIVKGLEIKTQADYDKAGEQFINLKKIQKDFLAEEREWLDPINKLRNKIFSYTRPARTKIAEAIENISEALGKYEERIATENAAKAKEIEDKVDSGEMKMSEGANAVNGLGNIEQVETGKGKIGQRVVYDLVLVDPEKVSKDFLIIDMFLVKERYQQTGVVPDGFKLEQKTIRTARLKV